MKIKEIFRNVLKFVFISTIFFNERFASMIATEVSIIFLYCSKKKVAVGFVGKHQWNESRNTSFEKKVCLVVCLPPGAQQRVQKISVHIIHKEYYKIHS